MNELIFYRGWHFFDHLVDAGVSEAALMDMFCAWHWTCHKRTAIDRTVTNHPIRVIEHPIPFGAPDPGRLEDLMLERASELWALGRPLTLLWSGGTDSTAAFIALMRTNPNWYDGLTMMMTDQIAVENPAAFNSYVKDSGIKNVAIARPADVSDHFRMTDSIVINGIGGDQIMSESFREIRGGNTMASMPLSQFRSKWFDMVYPFIYEWIRPNIPTGNSLQPWTSPILRKWYDVANYDQGRMDIWLDDHIAKCPFKLVDAFDLQWWLSFSLRWHAPYARMVSMTGTQKTFDNTYPFFMTDKFQAWSLHHHAEKFPVRDDWTTTKAPMKDFITAFSGRDAVKNKSNHAEVPFKDLVCWKWEYFDTAGNVKQLGKWTYASERVQEDLLTDEIVRSLIV